MSKFIRNSLVLAQIFIQFLFPVVSVFPVSGMASEKIVGIQFQKKSIYTLSYNETVIDVAKMWDLTIDELWTLNRYLFSSRQAFEKAKYRDVIYVPYVYSPTVNGVQQSQNTSLAQNLSQLGQALSSEDKESALISMGGGLLSSNIEQYLSQFGTAKINLSLTKDFNFSGASLDFLFPLEQKSERTTFSQFGMRRHDSRNIANIGFGQRFFNDSNSWMFGYNLFYDVQMSTEHKPKNNHHRFGVGLELWSDYIKLSTNGYFRLSGWKESGVLTGYDERVASGYDIVSEFYLPVYPALGASLKFEQYFGKEVALFNNTTLEKDPILVTLGMSYTPVPMFTIGIDHSEGSGKHSDTKVNFGVNYQFGVPISNQLNPDAMKFKRSLMGNRLDLVNRNNNIVFEYRANSYIKLTLPNDISGVEGEMHEINYHVESKYAVKSIQWDDSALKAKGGEIVALPGNRYQVKIPKFDAKGKHDFVVSGIAYDNQGNASKRAEMTVVVTGYDLNKVTAESSVTPDTLPADGKSQATIQVNLFSASGASITDMADKLNILVEQQTKGTSTPGKVSDVEEVSDGVYQAKYTVKTEAGKVMFTPVLKGSSSTFSSVTLTQSAVDDVAILSAIEPSKFQAKANGQDNIVYEALVLNEQNKPLSDINVSFSSNNEQVLLNQPSAKTNEKGIAVISVSSTKAVENIVITAKVDDKTLEATPVRFIADNDAVHLVKITTDKTSALANGKEVIKYTAVIYDSNDNPVESQAISWSVDLIGAKLSASSSHTNNKGEASIELSSAKAGDAIVVAELNSLSFNANKVTFNADASSATINHMTADKPSARADGEDKITYTAKIVDGNDNPLNNITVSFNSSNPDAKLSATTALTNEQGIATIYLSSIKQLDNIIVTANANNQKLDAKPVSFISDAMTSTVIKVAANKLTAKADDVDFVTLTATVVDKNQNPVADAMVSWMSSLNTLDHQTSRTDEKGQAVVTLKGTKSGDAQVKAQATSGEPVNADVIVFEALSANELNSAMSIAPQSIMADNTDTALVKIELKDKHNNPVLNAQDKITLEMVKTDLLHRIYNRVMGRDTSTVTISDITPLSDGVYTATVKGNAVGQYNVVATIEGDTRFTKEVSVGLLGQIDDVIFKSVTVDKFSAKADGTDHVTLTATLAYKSGDKAKNIPVGWATSLGLLSSPISYTNDQGVTEITLTSNNVGAAKVTAKVSEQVSMDVEKAINFTAGDVSADTSSLDIIPNRIVANGTDSANVIITLNDNKGNKISGAANDIHLSVMPDIELTVSNFDEIQNGIYSAKVSGTKVGKLTLTAKVAETTLIKTGQLTLTGDDTSAIIHSLTVDKREITAGNELVTYSAIILDKNSNPLQGIPISWHSNRSEDNYETFTTTDEQGKTSNTLSSTKAGVVIMNAALNASVKQDADEVTVKAAAIDATKSIFKTDKNTIGSAKDKASLSVILNDQYENKISGKQIDIGLSGGMDSFVVAPLPMKDEGNGLYTAEATSKERGEQELTAVVDNVELKQKVRIQVTQNVPDLRFDLASQKVSFTKRFKDSQKVKGLPEGVEAIWSTSDSSVAKVDKSTGTVTLTGVGEVLITVQSIANEEFAPAQASYTLTVTKAPLRLSFEEGKHSMVYGDTFELPVLSTGNDEILLEDLTLQWSSSNSDVATIDQTGKLIVNKSGDVIVSVEHKGSDNIADSQTTYALTVLKRKVDISFANPSLKISALKATAGEQSYKQKTNEALPEDIQVVWTSSNSDVLALNDDSSLKSATMGSTNIQLTVIEDDRYLKNNASYNVDVIGKASVEILKLDAISGGSVESGHNLTWKPYYVDDYFSAYWKGSSDKFNKVAKIKMKVWSQKLGTSWEPEVTLLEKELDVASGYTGSETITPKADLVERTIKISLIGYNELGEETDEVVETINTDYIELQKVLGNAYSKLKHNVYYNSDKSKYDGNTCRTSYTEYQKDVYMAWDTEIRPKRDVDSIFSHNIVQELFVNTRFNNGDLKSRTIPLSSGNGGSRLLFSSANDRPDDNVRIVEDCWANHVGGIDDQGLASMKVKISYGGKTVTLKSGVMEWTGDSADSKQNSINLTVK